MKIFSNFTNDDDHINEIFHVDFWIECMTIKDIISTCEIKMKKMKSSILKIQRL